jgi:hypothetical protein
MGSLDAGEVNQHRIVRIKCFKSVSIGRGWLDRNCEIHAQSLKNSKLIVLAVEGH